MSDSRQIKDSDVKPIIFREYIGVKPYPDTLHNFPTDIINSKIHQFHFILGFATETYDDSGKGTGVFNPSWNVHFFSPEKVKELKQNHKNVKVVISIGGRGDKHPFNPASKVEWPDNAVNSLKKIIQQYNEVKDPWSFNIIDGIDINYEYITSDGGDFSSGVGDVIKRLKEDTDLSVDVVSIAPSKPVNSKYHTLFLARHDYIDWVDYQFYFETLKSKDEFKNLFLSLSDVYGSKKLLAGASTDPDDAGKISREDFLEGVIDLLDAESLRGIFIWNANDSATPPPNGKPFSFEIKAQELLTKSG